MDKTMIKWYNPYGKMVIFYAMEKLWFSMEKLWLSMEKLWLSMEKWWCSSKTPMKMVMFIDVPVCNLLEWGYPHFAGFESRNENRVIERMSANMRESLSLPCMNGQMRHN